MLLSREVSTTIQNPEKGRTRQSTGTAGMKNMSAVSCDYKYEALPKRGGGVCRLNLCRFTSMHARRRFEQPPSWPSSSHGRRTLIGIILPGSASSVSRRHSDLNFLRDLETSAYKLGAKWVQGMHYILDGITEAGQPEYLCASCCMPHCTRYSLQTRGGLVQ